MNKQFITGLFAVLIVMLFGACNNEVTTIGEDTLDHLVGTDFMDTLTVQAYSYLEDTLNTTNLSANLVGDLHDPIFGDTRASIYSQFTLSGSSVNFGDHPQIDSVVLTMQLASYYGDTTSKVGIRVYQLQDAISSNGHYYSNSTIAHDNTPLNYSQTGYEIHPNSDVIVDTGSYSPHIRIRLTNAFGQYLLNNQEHMNSVEHFRNFFKGLCITAVSHTGSTGYMLITNMNSSLSGIVVYYHNDSKSSIKYTFPCSNKCKRFNNFTHNYNASNSSNFTQEVLAGQHEIGAQQLFVQASAGVKTRITFPYLAKTFESLGKRVVINRAELVITDVSPNETFLVHPAALSIQGHKSADGSVSYIPDDSYYSNADYFGGTYNAAKHEYRFRVTSYVQGIISGTSNLANYLDLVVKGSGVRANRLVIGGTGLNDNNRLRLELSYTTY